MFPMDEICFLYARHEDDKVYFLFPYKNIRKHGSLCFLVVYLF